MSFKPIIDLDCSLFNIQYICIILYWHHTANGAVQCSQKVENIQHWSESCYFIAHNWSQKWQMWVDSPVLSSYPPVNPPLWPLSTELHRFIRTQSHIHISTNSLLNNDHDHVVYEASFAVLSCWIYTFHFLHLGVSIFEEKLNSVRDLIGSRISIDISKRLIEFVYSKLRTKTSLAKELLTNLV